MAEAENETMPPQTPQGKDTTTAQPVPIVKLSFGRITDSLDPILERRIAENKRRD